MSVEADVDLFTFLGEQMKEPIPCEYAESRHCPKGEAKWVMYRVVCPECGFSGVAFACEDCKNQRMTAGHTVRCYNDLCHHLFPEARHAYRLVEPL